MGMLSIWLCVVTFMVLATTIIEGRSPLIYREMEIDAYKLTINLSGSKKRDASISSGAKGNQKYNFEGIRNKNLYKVKIIGNADKNVEVPNADEFQQFFRTLCQVHVDTINELTFVDHFPIDVVKELSKTLFGKHPAKKVTIKQLQLLRSPMELFDFTELETLKGFSILSFSSRSSGLFKQAFPYIVNPTLLGQLLDNNKNLNYVTVPQGSRPAFQVIFGKRMAADNFRLDVITLTEHIKPFLTWTKTEFSGSLLPIKTIEDHKQIISVNPPETLQAVSLFVNALPNDYFAGAEWTHVSLDVFLWADSYSYGLKPRFATAIATLRKQFKRLQQVDVRYILNSGSFQIEYISENTCGEGIPFSVTPVEGLSIITVHCKIPPKT